MLLYNVLYQLFDHLLLLLHDVFLHQVYLNTYHQNQKIAVLQVDIEKLVDFIYSGLDMKEDVLSVFLGNNRVVPMIYSNEKA